MMIMICGCWSAGGLGRLLLFTVVGELVVV